jgi:hypothetical protein
MQAPSCEFVTSFITALASRFRENMDVRKRGVSSVITTARRASGAQWMDMGQIATVKVTSEDPEFPIESVFTADGGPGWRASQKGQRQIRLIFDQPLAVRRIQLPFIEPNCAHPQEFTLRWLTADGGQPREIERQQWDFSPAGSTSEIEDYEVNTGGRVCLGAGNKPDLAHKKALATLAARMKASSYRMYWIGTPARLISAPPRILAW